MIMKKRIYQNAMNYDHTKQYKTVGDPISKTIPDQALTIPEIINRYASGRTPDVKIYNEYSGDNPNHTGVDIRTMDLSEIHELLEVTKQNAHNLKVETDRRRKEKQDQQMEQSIIAKYRARQEAKKPQQTNDDDAKFIQLDLPNTDK